MIIALDGITDAVCKRSGPKAFVRAMSATPLKMTHLRQYERYK